MTNCVGILQFDRQLHLSLAFSSPERTRANWVIFQSENCNKTNFSRFCLSKWVDTVQVAPFWNASSLQSKRCAAQCIGEIGKAVKSICIGFKLKRKFCLLKSSYVGCYKNIYLILWLCYMIYHSKPLLCFWWCKWQGRDEIEIVVCQIFNSNSMINTQIALIQVCLVGTGQGPGMPGIPHR